MFHTITFGGGTAVTWNANCVKKTKKTEIGHATMNIQEACSLRPMDLQQSQEPL